MKLKKRSNIRIGFISEANPSFIGIVIEVSHLSCNSHVTSTYSNEDIKVKGIYPRCSAYNLSLTIAIYITVLPPSQFYTLIWNISTLQSHQYPCWCSPSFFSSSSYSSFHSNPWPSTTKKNIERGFYDAWMPLRNVNTEQNLDNVACLCYKTCFFRLSSFKKCTKTSVNLTAPI